MSEHQKMRVTTKKDDVMKPLSSEKSGPAPAVTVRLDRDTYAKVAWLEQHSRSNQSEIIRAFIDGGLAEIAGDNPDRMSKPVELLWRSIEQPEPATLDVGKLQEQLAAITRQLAALTKKPGKAGR